jgi:hypothetical protein
MRKLIVPVAVLAILFTACGGDDSSSSDTVASGDTAGEVADSASDASDDSEQPTSDASEDASAPAPSGPVEMNTIRIGSTTWSRTLPMTSGQCFLYEDDGTLPTSANVWGTLDGDDDIRFSANYGQDGTFEAEVVDESAFFWIAGRRSPEVDDLVIELDFEALTITGSGTFANVGSVDPEQGAFAFQCEPEDG